jgi:hypothetical protein
VEARFLHFARDSAASHNLAMARRRSYIWEARWAREI